MRVFLSAIACIVVFLILIKILVIIIEPKLTFFPYRQIDQTPKDYGINYQEYFIDSPDGIKLCAWYLPSDEPIAELVFFHGNAGNLSKGRLELLVELNRQGFSVFVFDYRGYGKSSGSCSESGVLADSAAATEFFWQELHQAGMPVIYHGRSIGGLTASFAAKFREPNGLILEATFPDKKTLLQYYPLTLRFLALFSRYELSTETFLKEVSCPILVIHGDQDELVPYQVGKELYSRLENPDKRFLTIEGASHEDQATVGREVYWPEIIQFASELDSSSSSDE